MSSDMRPVPDLTRRASSLSATKLQKQKQKNVHKPKEYTIPV